MRISKLILTLTLSALVFLAFPEISLAAPTHIISGTVDESWPDGNGNNDNNFNYSTEEDNLFMIIIVSWRNSAGHVINDQAVSYANASATPFGAQIESVQATIKAFYLVNPATGNNAVRVYTSDGTGVNPNAIVSVSVFSDVDQITPFDNYTSSTGVDDSAELTVTSAEEDTPYFAFTWRGGGGTTITPTGYTERVDNFANSGGVGAGAGNGIGGASADFTGLVNGEFASNGWAAIGFNMNAVSASTVNRGFLRFFNGLMTIRSSFMRIGR